MMITRRIMESLNLLQKLICLGLELYCTDCNLHSIFRMTRHPLFESDKTKELLSMNKKCNFTKIFIDGYTKELNFILMGLLDVNPIKRFSSEEAIRFLSS